MDCPSGSRDNFRRIFVPSKKAKGNCFSLWKAINSTEFSRSLTTISPPTIFRDAGNAAKRRDSRKLDIMQSFAICKNGVSSLCLKILKNIGWTRVFMGAEFGFLKFCNVTDFLLKKIGISLHEESRSLKVVLKER